MKTPEAMAAQAHYADGHQKGCSPACAVEIFHIEAAIKQAVAEERERCANIAEEMTMEREVEETRGHVRVSLIAERIREGK